MVVGMKLRAYSLIEMLMVLGVFVLLTSAVFFTGGRILQGFQFTQFMNELRLATSRMQTEAQSDLIERVILFRDREYVLAKRLGGGEILISKTAYPASVKKISGDQIAFARSGVPSQAGSIVFKNSASLEKKLVVAPVTRRIRIE
jgi:type II secretory pathway pseudopilin PulG